MAQKLCYCSPVYGGRGLISIGAQVPESFVLMIAPESCGIHSAVKLLEKDYRGNNGYLFLTEGEISMGDIEENIYAAVDRIIQVRKEPIKVFMLIFTCVIFIAGVDQDLVRKELSRRHPGVVFQISLMNPISHGTDHEPAMMLYSRMAELFDFDGPQEDAANFIGNGVPIDEGNELYEVLEKCGVKRINFPFAFKRYEEFRVMGHARWNLVMSENGIRAAKEMQPRMDYRYIPMRYDLDGIRREYESLFDMFGKSVDLSSYEKEARDAIADTARFLDGMSIAVGSSASAFPMNLARMLLENGFNVTEVFKTDIYSDLDSKDREDMEWIQANHPEVRVIGANDPLMCTMYQKCGRVDLAVGFTAGYFAETGRIANVMFDEGMFGYRGIVAMMKRMRAAVEHPTDLRTLVKAYGIVIRWRSSSYPFPRSPPTTPSR